MSAITLLNGRSIGDYLQPYIVAEMNTSHFGDMDVARSMIDQAKMAGCDCVKFQSWSVETLYCESYYQENAIAKRMVKKFALNQVQLELLAGYAGSKDIAFTSTPYSIEEARFLVEVCHVPFVKIASMELNNLPYLSQLGNLGVPLVLSTGMGTLEEIQGAVHTLETIGNPSLILLHCTSVYPASPEIIRLQNIVGLRSEFPKFPIGYSDHSDGLEIPAAAVALGACLIEKHFTLDSTRIGMDNQMATEPEAMQAMVRACHRVHQAMGGTGRVLSRKEQSQIPKMRRSIITKRPLQAGHILTEADLDTKRPGTGLAPTALTTVLGKTLREDLDAETVLTWQVLEE
jgi:N-acetylneuraminate synthase